MRWRARHPALELVDLGLVGVDLLGEGGGLRLACWKARVRACTWAAPASIWACMALIWALVAPMGSAVAG